MNFNFASFPDIKLKEFLDIQYELFNNLTKLHEHADPLNIVHEHKNHEYIDELALICALYAYGNANLIVKHLKSMPFHLLSQKHIDDNIESFPYYRFQNKMDTRSCFLAMRHAIECGGIKHIFFEAFKKKNSVLDGINALVRFFESFLRERNLLTRGTSFLFGKSTAKGAPLKRYNMFLRWMSRHDNIDLGLWSELHPKHLIIPLDTHTFYISRILQICTMKTPTISAAIHITKNLAVFDPNDPVKYDFAMYRIGQLNLIP